MSCHGALWRVSSRSSAGLSQWLRRMSSEAWCMSLPQEDYSFFFIELHSSSLASSCFSLVRFLFFSYYKYYLHNSLSFTSPIKVSLGFPLAATVDGFLWRPQREPPCYEFELGEKRIEGNMETPLLPASWLQHTHQTGANVFFLQAKLAAGKTKFVYLFLKPQILLLLFVLFKYKNKGYLTPFESPSASCQYLVVCSLLST